MANIKVDPQILRSKGTELQEKTQNIQQYFNEIKDKMNVICGMWESNSSIEMRDKFTGITAVCMEKIIADMQKYRDFLETAARNWEQQESDDIAELRSHEYQA